MRTFPRLHDRFFLSCSQAELSASGFSVQLELQLDDEFKPLQQSSTYYHTETVSSEAAAGIFSCMAAPCTSRGMSGLLLEGEFYRISLDGH